MEVIGDRSGNTFLVEEGLASRIGGTVTFVGTDNVLEVAGPFTASGVTLLLGGGAQVRLGRACVAGHLEIHAPRGGEVEIGEGCSFNGLVRLLVHEPARITIGHNCLIGADVVVTVSDMHSILDATTGERVNPARDVAIADNVWLGYRAFVGKGARIGEGSIVGAQSFVSGLVEPRTLVAGQPARALRTGVRWSQELL